MGRYSSDSEADGPGATGGERSTFSAVLTPPAGIPTQSSAPAEPGQPLTRRQLRELERPTEVFAAPPAVEDSFVTSPSYLAQRFEWEPPAEIATKPDSKRAKELRSRRPVKLAQKLLSIGALLFAAVLMIGTSVPANAFMSDANAQAIDPAAGASASIGSQSLAVPADATAASTARDSYSVISYAQLLQLQYGNRSYSFTATSGAIRWPFPYAVPISDGFGARVAPCLGCSTNHLGVDFTPGSGTPIYAIADGIVTTHDDSQYGFGNHVIISHPGIPGQHVDSLYAHMQTGSSALVAGQEIKAGDFIGLVGETGEAVGAHLHFEIHLDGIPVDPFAWLTANAVN